VQRFQGCFRVDYSGQKKKMANVEDPVLAKPADLCCLKGDFHKGEPTGEMIQIEGIDTYVAKPDSKTANGNVILFMPDAFGLHINSKLMMDAYAACGYLTLGVDYFLGVGTTRLRFIPIQERRSPAQIPKYLC
jgi:hypothetical protein